MQVRTVSEGIAALQSIQAEHGNLQMLNEDGGPFQFTATMWTEEDRRKAGFTAEELPDGVTIDGGMVASMQVSRSLWSDLDNIQSSLVIQIAAGKAACELIGMSDNIDGDFSGVFAATTLAENVFDKLEGIATNVAGIMCDAQKMKAVAP